MYPIPANATRIRYLESTGTQFIDTGVVPGNNEIDFEIVCMNLATGGIAPFFGCRDVIADGIYVPSNYSAFVRSNNGGEMRADISNAGGARYTNLSVGVPYSLNWDHTNLKLTRTNLDAGASAATIANSKSQNDYTFALYGINTAGTFAGGAEARIYSAKFYRAGTLVRSFVPVRVGSTGYLFDRVSGTLFGNAGTGSFVLGPDTFSQGVLPTRMMPMGGGAMRHKEILGSVAFSGEMDSNLEWYDSSSSGPGDFTFSAWVRAAASPTRGAFAKIGNRQVGSTPGAGIGLGFGSSRFDPSYSGQNFVALAESVAWANSPSNASTINLWHHYAATLSGYVLSVYIDGTLFWTNTFSSVKSMSPFTFYLGGNRGGGSGGDTNRFLACNMTRSAFWNRVLSASEVAQDYADGKNAPTTTSGLEHFWPMSNAKNYLADAVGSATLTAGVGGVTISTDTPFA